MELESAFYFYKDKAKLEYLHMFSLFPKFSFSFVQATKNDERTILLTPFCFLAESHEF